MIIFFWALCAGTIMMLIMRTSRYRPPFTLAPAWRESTVTRHRSAPVPDRDWVIA